MEAIFRTSPSFTHLPLLPQSLSMRFSTFTALVVAFGRFIEIQRIFFFVEYAFFFFRSPYSDVCVTNTYRHE